MEYTQEQLSEVLKARPDLQERLQHGGMYVLQSSKFIEEVKKTIEILDREKIQKRVLAGITETLNERWGSTGNGEGEGLTLEKIKKSKEILECESIRQEMEDIKEYLSACSPELQRELYEYMYNTLGLRIYK